MAQRFRLTPQSLKLSEKEVTQACNDWLRMKGFFMIRLNSGLLATPDGRRMRVGVPGLLDWIGIRNGGAAILVEYEATGKKPSEEQEEFMRFCEFHKIPCVWADGLGRLMIEIRRFFEV